MTSSAHDWTEGQAFCATVVMGLDVDGVCAALAGVKRSGTVTGLDYFNMYPRPPATDLLAVLPVDHEVTVLLEDNGIRGVDDEVLAKLAGGGYALSAFQSVNLLIFLYGAACEGAAATQTVSEDWAMLRQLRVDEPLPHLPAGSVLATMRDIGFLTQESAEAIDMDTYLREIADFWPNMFEFIKRATGVDLTTEFVLGPGWSVVELASQ